MSHRAVRLLAVISLSGAAAACSGPEQKVVDNYFNAVRAQDNQTLSSFAAVTFKDPVTSWKVQGARDEPDAQATLPALSARVKDLETQVAAAKKEWDAYKLQRWADLQKVNELKQKNSVVPASLTSVAGEWDKYTQKDRDLKKQLAAAKTELEKEKRSARLSVGDLDGLEDMTGTVKTKQVDVEVMSNGQPRQYTMTLRKYDLKREGGTAPMSRWVVQDLKPKG